MDYSESILDEPSKAFAESIGMTGKQKISLDKQRQF